MAWWMRPGMMLAGLLAAMLCLGSAEARIDEYWGWDRLPPGMGTFQDCRVEQRRIAGFEIDSKSRQRLYVRYTDGSRALLFTGAADTVRLEGSFLSASTISEGRPWITVIERRRDASGDPRRTVHLLFLPLRRELRAADLGFSGRKLAIQGLHYVSDPDKEEADLLKVRVDGRLQEYPLRALQHALLKDCGEYYSLMPDHYRDPHMWDGPPSSEAAPLPRNIIPFKDCHFEPQVPEGAELVAGPPMQVYLRYAKGRKELLFTAGRDVHELGGSLIFLLKGQWSNKAWITIEELRDEGKSRSAQPYNKHSRHIFYLPLRRELQIENLGFRRSQAEMWDLYYDYIPEFETKVDLLGVIVRGDMLLYPLYELEDALLANCGGILYGHPEAYSLPDTHTRALEAVIRADRAKGP